MLSILIAAMFDRWQDANQRLAQYAILEEVKMSKLPSQPNFVIFLTDDQGYGDLSCMGGTDFKTPHLDRMAAEGARLTDWYSNSPVCSPSRLACEIVWVSQSTIITTLPANG